MTKKDSTASVRPVAEMTVSEFSCRVDQWASVREPLGPLMRRYAARTGAELDPALADYADGVTEGAFTLACSTMPGGSRGATVAEGFERVRELRAARENDDE